MKRIVSDREFEGLLRTGDPLPEPATLAMETAAAQEASRGALRQAVQARRAAQRRRVVAARGRPAAGPPLVAAFTVCPAPWGLLHVAATGGGIVAIRLDAETPAFADDLARRLRGRVVPMEDGAVPAAWRARLAAATAQVGEYLAGRRTRFDLAVDWTGVSDWDRRVLAGAARIGFGETASYAELARRIGKPGAARAVGSAMSRNPVPLIVPCHRVIAADGSLGGYGGATYADRQAALAVKRRLLNLEGAWSAA
jgi:methylated-DNA-[protein]-cysteine S-methyltransferase